MKSEASSSSPESSLFLLCNEFATEGKNCDTPTLPEEDWPALGVAAEAGVFTADEGVSAFSRLACNDLIESFLGIWPAFPTALATETAGGAREARPF